SLLGGEELIGHEFGEYCIEAMIGQGGMGTVYKGLHRRMQRTIAVKTLRADPIVSNDAEAVPRFEREVRAAAKLSHPNIVTAFDAGEQDGWLYLVMEFVDGRNLEKKVREDGALGVAEAVDAILDAAKALAHAHNQNVYHRDVKPANLILDPNGVVKLLDMGLSRINEEVRNSIAETTGGAGVPAPDRLTRKGTLLGTLDYMAAEQALNVQNADHRADVYSLGCTLHYLLTKRPPFEWQNVIEAINKHQYDKIPSLRASRKDVPASLDAIFKKMLAKKPEDRYQCMEDLIEDLNKVKAKIALGGWELADVLASPLFLAASFVLVVLLSILITVMILGQFQAG
ncbi:MAG: serine/threonine protein kinase, partial [Planctomycetales bacterium]